MAQIGVRLRAATETTRRTWFSVFFVVLAVYLATAHWQVGQVVDSLAASWPGYALRTHGTLFLDSTEAVTSIAIGEAQGHPVSLRTPGVILVGIPVHLTVGWIGLDVEQGGALTAALLGAMTIANVAVVLRGLVRRSLVLPVTTVVAFGTSMWTVAGAELWTHAPDVFFLTSALVLLQRQQAWAASAFLAAAVLTRPHLAVVPAALGVAQVVATRRWTPLVRFGLPAATALLATIAWNAWYVGQPRLLIGAYAGQSDRLTDGPQTDFSPSLVDNAMGFLVSPGVGLFLFTPVALVAVPCLVTGWRRAPWWVRGAALGALGYTLVQAKLNHFHGGGGFFGYRLLLEALVLLVPLVALGYETTSRDRPWLRRVTRLAAEASIAIYAMGANLAYYWRGGTKDWDVWYPWWVLRSAATAALPIAVVVVSALVLARLLTKPPTRHPERA